MWQKLDTLWYRRTDLYSLHPTDWAADRDKLRLSVVAAAPFGGPIATVRNEKIFQPSRGALRPQLQTYTAAGRRLGSAQWTFRELIAMEWADEEVLVCVFGDGVVRTFSALCEQMHFFTVDERIKNEGGVIQACVFDNGVVLLSAALRLYANFSLERAQCTRLADAGLRSPPMSMCVLFPPHQSARAAANLHVRTPDGRPAAVSPSLSSTSMSIADLRVLVAAESGQLLLVDNSQSVDLKLEDGPFCALAVSRSHRLVACLSRTGIFKVLSSHNLTRPLDVATLDVRKKPKQMVWCGDDCIALHLVTPTPSGGSQHMVFLGGPKNDWLPYAYDTSVCLVSELDGVRILTADKSEMLHRVHPSTEAIFSIGSCEAPAMLTYALEKYEAGDVAADESLRAIKEELGEATTACIEAAAHEPNPEQIRQLLRAAVFGRHFLDTPPDPVPFVEACRNIRVCLAVRGPPYEIPITVAQLQKLGIANLIDRLAKRRYHLLAYRLCEYVGLPASKVLLHWATEKIRHTLELTDDQLCKEIVRRFHGCPNISYSAVASVAANAARPNLACMLLEHEIKSQAQVRMLLKLAETRLATDKAVASGDPDLILECLAALTSGWMRPTPIPTHPPLTHTAAQAPGSTTRRRDDAMDSGLGALLEAIKDRPAAADLFVAMCKRTQKWEELQRYYDKRGSYMQGGVVSLTLALQKADWEQRKPWLTLAAQFFNPATHSSAKGPSEHASKFAFEATMDQLDLLGQQRDLELKAHTQGWRGGPPRFVGLPLVATLRQLILRGEMTEADHLRQHFKVPDKRYWRVKIDALADSGNIDELLTFAQLRTSPIGYDPFIAACVRVRAVDAAVKLIPRLRDPEAQAKWFSQLGLNEEAEAALRRPPTSQQLGGGFLQTLTGAVRRLGQGQPGSASASASPMME